MFVNCEICGVSKGSGTVRFGTTSGQTSKMGKRLLNVVLFGIPFLQVSMLFGSLICSGFGWSTHGNKEPTSSQVVSFQDSGKTYF